MDIINLLDQTDRLSNCIETMLQIRSKIIFKWGIFQERDFVEIKESKDSEKWES